ncbi:MAG: hypothetical protein BAJALOKI3v1_30011 [Promethearchaeota archaeon]|nr:MAG: hypothetical protein BAJALOKI3v1_30011 [Candidatus Lokiarchaeota archaeon]
MFVVNDCLGYQNFKYVLVACENLIEYLVNTLLAQAQILLQIG